MNARDLRATEIKTDFKGSPLHRPCAGWAVPGRLADVREESTSTTSWPQSAWGSPTICPPKRSANGIANCGAVPGRFERVEEGQPFLVVVDYAHTDDALRNVIAAARELSPKRILTVFGCGGDRDRTKRPLMGQAVGEGSDFVVLTSDNPRSEDPLAIMNDALVGLRRQDVPHKVEPDRESAIQLALAEANAGDIVLIAGKGHETYQILKDRTIAFDDREVARRLLRRVRIRTGGRMMLPLPRLRRPWEAAPRRPRRWLPVGASIPARLAAATSSSRCAVRNTTVTIRLRGARHGSVGGGGRANGQRRPASCFQWGTPIQRCGTWRVGRAGVGTGP